MNYDTKKKCLKSHDNLFLTQSNVYPDVHLDIYPIVSAPADKKEQDKVTFWWNYMDRIIRSKYVDIQKCLPKNKVLVAVVHESFEICLTQNAIAFGFMMWFMMGLGCNLNLQTTEEYLEIKV